MPISGTRRMMTGGWGNPKLDLKDPSLVLYLPLWYPDSETTGSTIISKDIYRRTGTVTGATWGTTGRTFDGTNDLITLANLFSASSTALTICAWVKLTTLGTARHIMLQGWAAAGSILFFTSATDLPGFSVRTTAGDSDAVSSTALSVNTWTFLTAYFDQSGDQKANILINAVAKGSGLARNGTFGTTHIAQLGRSDANTWLGIMGAVWAYNRALTPLEIQRNYIVTKWRYS